MIPTPRPENAAVRLGRFRRARDGRWSARFVLAPGPEGEAAIDQVEELAVCMGRSGGLSEEDAIFVGVALREAVVNAFRHGRSPDNAPARIGLHLTRGCLVITVRDRGPGFDPGSIPDPRDDENLSRNCGRGIFYMRCFTDRVSFCFPRVGGSVVRLAKRMKRDGEGAPAAAQAAGCDEPSGLLGGGGSESR